MSGFKAARRLVIRAIDTCNECPHSQMKIHSKGYQMGEGCMCRAMKPKGMFVGYFPMTSSGKSKPAIPKWCPLPAEGLGIT